MQFPVEPIAPGYAATIAIAYPKEVADALSLGAGVLTADFRAAVDDAATIFEATTADGSIVVTVGATETLVTVTIPAAVTSLFTPDTDVLFDFVRTEGAVIDVIPGRWLWPVRKTVTR